VNTDDHRWAVILSARDGEPAIRAAIRRAQAVVPLKRICIIVEPEHRPYWRPLMSVVPAANLLVQPRCASSVIGILFAVLQFLDRDSFAQMFIVACDHFFENEATIYSVMCRASNAFHTAN
jgi:mannose-1-phosphate guanylyltransferase